MELIFWAGHFSRSGYWNNRPISRDHLLSLPWTVHFLSGSLVADVTVLYLIRLANGVNWRIFWLLIGQFIADLGFFGFIQFFDIFVAGWHLRGAQDSNIIQEYLLNIFIFKDSFYLTFSLEVKKASPQLERPWWLIKHDSRYSSHLTALLHPTVS